MRKSNNFIGRALTFFLKFFEIEPAQLADISGIPIKEINDLMENKMEIPRDRTEHIAQSINRNLHAEHLLKEEKLKLDQQDAEELKGRLAVITIKKLDEYYDRYVNPGPPSGS